MVRMRVDGQDSAVGVSAGWAACFLQGVVVHARHVHWRFDPVGESEEHSGRAVQGPGEDAHVHRPSRHRQRVTSTSDLNE